MLSTDELRVAKNSFTSEITLSSRVETLHRYRNGKSNLHFFRWSVKFCWSYLNFSCTNNKRWWIILTDLNESTFVVGINVQLLRLFYLIKPWKFFDILMWFLFPLLHSYFKINYLFKFFECSYRWSFGSELWTFLFVRHLLLLDSCGFY